MGRLPSTRSGVAVAALVLLPLSSVPASASAIAPAAARADARVVGVGGPDTMILRPGCRENYRAAAVFDAVEGEEYWTVINAEDATGRDIDGDIREGVVTESGRITVAVPLLLCGSVHDAGVGRIKVGLIVGDSSVDLRKRVAIKYDDRVSLRKAERAHGRTTLRGTWDRGKGFERGLTTYVRKSVRVHLHFKSAGRRSWKRVATTRIDSQGRWHARVGVGKAGRWQARIDGSKRLLPARSQVRRTR